MGANGPAFACAAGGDSPAQHHHPIRPILRHGSPYAAALYSRRAASSSHSFPYSRLSPLNTSVVPGSGWQANVWMSVYGETDTGAALAKVSGFSPSM